MTAANAISDVVSKRITLLSFIAAVLVVFIHVPKPAGRGLNHFLECGICEIAVPFFLVVSGYMIARHVGENGWWRREAGKRVKSLLIPYLFWCLMATLVYAGTYVAVNIYKGAALTRNLETFTFAHTFGFDLTNRPVNGPLWYVRELLLLLLPLPIVAKIVMCRHRWVGAIFLLVCLALQVLVSCHVASHPSVQQFYAYCLSPRALLFYSAGVWLCRHPVRLDRRVGVCCFLLGLGLLVFRTLTLDAAINQVVWYRTLLWMVSIIVFLIGTWSLVPAWKLPAALVGIAFPMYLMHDIIIHPLGVLLNKVGLWPGLDKTLVGVFTVWVGVTILCIVVSYCLRTFLPRVSKIIFGGR